MTNSSPTESHRARMNPFGIVQAIAALLEGVAHAANPKRKKESKNEQRRFLFFYNLFMLLAIAAATWALHSFFFPE